MKQFPQVNEAIPSDVPEKTNAVNSSSEAPSSELSSLRSGENVGTMGKLPALPYRLWGFGVGVGGGPRSSPRSLRASAYRHG
jgi:hypothetical protein